MIEEVKNYYDNCVEYEWNRLQNDYSVIEYYSTMYLIEKYFPKAGRILDVGSGPGRYALSLLKQGYAVTLLDLSANALSYAQKLIEEHNLTADGYINKSALELDDLNQKFDALLVMGPLYHLHHKDDRIKVLRHAFNLLKEEGIAIVSYINTWGVLRASVSEFPESFDTKDYFDKYIKGDLRFSGEESFTATFFTTPPHALEEVAEAGFEIISYAGAESFLSGLNMQLKHLKQEMPDIYRNYLEKAAEYCEYPQYRDATEHLHVVVKKP